MLWRHNAHMAQATKTRGGRETCVVGLAQRAGRVLLALTLVAGTASCFAAEPGDDLESIVRRAQADRRVYEGWRAVRQLDCARCHGADYRGSVGPSLLEFVLTRSRDDFMTALLEGNIQRGMPPYNSVARAVENREGIYDYLRGLAEGRIPPGALTPPE